MNCSSVLKSAGIIESPGDLVDFKRPEIRSRYRKWALRNHPDKAPGNEKVFVKVRQCYERMEKGEAADEKRPEPPKAPKPKQWWHTPTHAPKHSQRNSFAGDDDDALVREFMRRYGEDGGSRGRQRARRPYFHQEFERPRTQRSPFRSQKGKPTASTRTCTCKTSRGSACKITPTRGSTCHVHRRTGCSRL